ncbi:MAG: hypothetical protein AAGA71_17195 [Pseudomonadota bacterium]
MSATIFSNADLIAAWNSGELKIERMESGQYVPVPQTSIAELNRASEVQPASLDLSIGRIFQPPEEQWDPSKLPEEPPFKTGHEIAVGGTVVVETRERLSLSGKIGAFGFPPASMAKNSILMTNPGHVDPGFEGHLTFTIINMGRVPYDLKFGGNLATLLVFGFDAPVVPDYAALAKTADPEPNLMAKVLNRLSPDFADFEARSEKSAINAAEVAIAARTKALGEEVEAARTQYQNAERKYNIHALVWPAVTALGAAAITATVSYFVAASGFANKDTLDAVDERVETLEENQVLPDNIDALSDRIDDLQRAAVAPETVASLNERIERLEGEELLESLDERLQALETAIEVLGSGAETPEASE